MYECVITGVRDAVDYAIHMRGDSILSRSIDVDREFYRYSALMHLTRSSRRRVTIDPYICCTEATYDERIDPASSSIAE